MPTGEAVRAGQQSWGGSEQTSERERQQTPTMLWVYALRPMTQLAVVPSLSNTRSLGEDLGPRTRLGECDPGPGTRLSERDLPQRCCGSVH